MLWIINIKQVPSPASFSFIFGLFKQKYNFYNKYMWLLVHLGKGGIWTHNLVITSLLL